MKTKILDSVVALVAVVALVVSISVAIRPTEQPVELAGGYSTDCYREIGGGKWIAASGCEWEMQSGSTLDVQSGTSTTFGGNVAVDGTLDVDGATTLNSALDVDGNITSGTGAITVTDSVNVNNTLTLSKGSGNALLVSAGGTISLPATSDVSAFGYVAVGDGTPDGSVTAGNDEELYVEGELEVDGEAEFDGAIDADSTLNVAGASTLVGAVTGPAVGVENVRFPSVVSTAITYTAAAGGTGTVATIGDGEIWFVHDVFVNVTTNFDATGDDATLVIGDGNDANGFIDLADAELQTADTEATGFAAGWQGLIPATQGVYIDEAVGANTFIYAPSGADETIDWLVDETSGETITAGAATIYVVYTRIQ
jgi:cytoskeletal protein CcmA (bactofilin family)